jgi:hypothetical protein
MFPLKFLGFNLGQVISHRVSGGMVFLSPSTQITCNSTLKTLNLYRHVVCHVIATACRSSFVKSKSFKYGRKNQIPPSPKPGGGEEFGATDATNGKLETLD